MAPARGRSIDVVQLLAIQVFVAHQSLLFRPQLPSQDTAFTALERGFVYVEFVRVDSALHDILAQTVGGVDKYHIAEAAVGIQRKHDATGGAVGAHHLHHRNSQVDLEMIEAVAFAIADSAFGK